ncbi:MAG: phosphatidylglycerophosphatase A [Verrucomicrobia bacterium]|nr:phosphatidylglycerophosphatase A [Verrucomicrobiota bacterium]
MGHKGEYREEERLKNPSVWQRFLILAGTGFGLGYSPIASGTVGTIWGVVIVLALAAVGLTPVMLLPFIAVALVLSALAIPVCDTTERYLGRKDDGRIVADEYMTFPICVIGLPLVPWVLVMAFLTNRFFDILKPPPARNLQNIKGGTGVVIDDVLASAYSLVLNHVLYYVIRHILAA